MTCLIGKGQATARLAVTLFLTL
ncbi:hypothetical protein AGR7C_Lc120059 [Agrobacterium deltaense Zutra 3/1]|uniref:Uncharacterized protein n=1 Tax=Agrobacterium deltaense Zutra 3/1 TaxID=1183427 RepID=A0A1S7R2P1_9HYPH|nr:hypothetical protein AGR7C_Lc120059 [Agrobacterium deltaense Zutra 3/1]